MTKILYSIKIKTIKCLLIPIFIITFIFFSLILVFQLIPICLKGNYNYIGSYKASVKLLIQDTKKSYNEVALILENKF